MSIPDDSELQRAAKAEAREQRDRDAARAKQEYEAQTAALRARSAALRELRLAQEAGGKPAETVNIPPTRRARVKR